MLSIKNLHAGVDNTPILKGLNLEIGAGEVHAIMGPNGSGKSTLAHVLTGRDGYQVSAGDVLFNNELINDFTVEQRAHLGIFLAMQYPVELPGVNNMIFLKESLNRILQARNEAPLDAVGFIKRVNEVARKVNMDPALLKRNVNSGFSGGEKKRNEIFQMALLEPKLAILDETDSGLDIDALRIVSEGVNALRDRSRSMIIVTHYQRLLDYIEPDFVHVLAGGRIIRSGDKTLALELEDKGYSWLLDEVAA